MSNRGFRWWLGTWNNPPEDYISILKNSGAQYGRGQKEKGQQEGTLHIQFVLFFAECKNFNKVKQLLPEQLHLSGKAGAAKKDICNYVWKDDTAVPDTRFEFGRAQHITKQNHEKYTQAIEQVKENSILEIDPEILVKHYTNLLKLAARFLKPYEHHECRGVWIYGCTGEGKSHLARQLSGEDMYCKMQNKWWDNYSGQRSVLLDDLDSPALGHHLKLWLDKYEQTGEIKGGTVALQYITFYITSQYLPAELWSDQRMVDAIQRRCKFGHVRNREVSWGLDFGLLPVITRVEKLEIFPGMFL